MISLKLNLHPVNYLILPFLILLIGCSENQPKEITRLDFPYKNNYSATYFTKSALYKEDGSVRFSDSTFLTLKINKQFPEKYKKVHEWLMLPGVYDKNIPDTMVTVIDSSGLFTYYSEGFLPGADAEIKLISLPLTKGKVWQSSYLSFPAKATYLATDTIIKTSAGEFKSFAIQYEFSPYYMNEFLSDTIHEEIRGRLVDYYSLQAGKVFTKIDYYVTDKKSGNKKWRILSNYSKLDKLYIPEN